MENGKEEKKQLNFDGKTSRTVAIGVRKHFHCSFYAECYRRKNHTFFLFLFFNRKWQSETSILVSYLAEMPELDSFIPNHRRMMEDTGKYIH